MRNAAKLIGDGLGGGTGVWGLGAGRPDAAYNDTQREGLRLFSQSCGVCRTVVFGPAHPAISSGAGAVARETLGGDEELMREYIGNGTPRMPGFRFYFEPEQIGAIVAYLKTVPPQPAPAAGS